MRIGFVIVTTVGLTTATWISVAPMSAMEYTISERSVNMPNESQPTPYLLLVPPDSSGGSKQPLIVYLYGRGGSHTFYNLSGQPYAKLRRMAAERGYYIIVPELGTDHWMNDRAQRTLDAIISHALSGNPIDPKRIHLMGTSMGGASALAYAIHRPDLVVSICAVCPITDFAQWVAAEGKGYTMSVSTAYGGLPAELPSVWAKTSAMQNLDAFKSIPVFLVHGTADTAVDPGQSRQLAQALRARHYQVILREPEGQSHSDAVVEPFQEAIIDFLDKAAAARRR